MAIGLNTIVYAWETNPVAQSGSVLYSTPVKRIYIPETGSRTFLSVNAEMYMRDANDGTTISNITNFAFSASVDENLGGDPAASQTIVTTVDHTTLLFKESFTSLFNTRFTGSNHDVRLLFQLPQANSGRWIGHSFRLICTYQYDDTNVETNIKTVSLPIDAYLENTLPTVQTVFGKTTGGYTNIPNLSTFLPETNKQIRDYWIEYNGIDSSTVATDINIVTQIDSGSENTRFVLQNNMNTDTFIFDIESGSFTTNAAHTLKARASLGARIVALSPTLWVTYEYATTSSMTLQSCMIPMLAENNKYGNSVEENIYQNAYFLIPEKNPGLAHSAIVNILAVGPANPRRLAVNGTNIVTATLTRGNNTNSPTIFNLRFDENARVSAGYTLREGYNRLTYAMHGSPSVFGPSKYTSYLLLNYSASSNGVLKNNRTVYFGSGSVIGYNVVTRRRIPAWISSGVHSDITSSYYTNGYLIFDQFNASATSVYTGYVYDYTGSMNISHSVMLSTSFPLSANAELGFKSVPAVGDIFKQYHNEPDNYEFPKLEYFDRIPYYFYVDQTARPYFRADYITFNQNKIGVTGSLLNCNFPSNTYNLKIYLSGSNVPIKPISLSVSSGSGTSKKFYFDWYENINGVYAVSDYPEFGISNLVTASNGDILTINFGGSSGGERSHTWIG